MTRPKTAPGPKSAARGAGKLDAIREAAPDPADTASGRALVDVLCADPALSKEAAARVRGLADRTLSAGDLVGLLGYRLEKLSAAVQAGEMTADRELATLDKIGVAAATIAQLQAAQQSIGGATITVSWGGYQATAPTAGRAPRHVDAVVGDIVEAE